MERHGERLGLRIREGELVGNSNCNVCNCVKHTLPTGIENGGKNLGEKLEKMSY